MRVRNKPEKDGDEGKENGENKPRGPSERGSAGGSEDVGLIQAGAGSFKTSARLDRSRCEPQHRQFGNP